MFVRYDQANVCFGCVCYNSVLLLVVGKVGRLWHNRRHYAVFNGIKYSALKYF
jgi:hypothetical protein